MKALTHALSRLLYLLLVLIFSLPSQSVAQAQTAPPALIFANFTCDTMASMGGCYNSSIDLSEIYRINVDGSGMVNLTPQALNGFIYDLAVSPDGTRVAFLLNPGASATGIIVYTMNTDGTNMQAVLSDSDGIIYTSVLWSPDGTQLLLQDANSTRRRQSLMSANGSEPEAIRAFQVGLKIEVTDWVADGRFFAYDQMGSLLWVNPDGSERTAIVTIGAMSYQPHAVPSPDLTRFAYFTQLDEPQFGTDALVITDANGETEQTFTDIVPGPNNTGNMDVYPDLRWSPDGSLIAYVAVVEIGYHSLLVIGADGTNRFQVTPTSMQVFAFDWLPQSAS